MRKFQVMYFFVAVMLVVASCTKTEAGPKGETGDKGTTGSASVTKSFVLATTQWTKDTSNTAQKKWVSSAFIDELTQSVVDKGSVRVLMKFDGQWFDLPYLDGDEVTQFSFGLNKLHFLKTDPHGGLPEKPGTIDVRLVIISAP